MELNNLSKDELIHLKNEVENKLQKIVTKETKPNKDSILGLRNGDKIFGIRLSFGGHHLKEPDELNGKVDIIDYCIVESNDLRADDFRIGITYPKSGVGFGINCTLAKNDYLNEHCLLFMDISKSGYDAFYTLKPKTWKKDLKRMYQKKLKRREKYYQEELDLYDKKLNLFLDGEENINQYV